LTALLAPWRYAINLQQLWLTILLRNSKPATACCDWVCFKRSLWVRPSEPSRAAVGSFSVRLRSVGTVYIMDSWQVQDSYSLTKLIFSLVDRQEKIYTMSPVPVMNPYNEYVLLQSDLWCKIYCNWVRVWKREKNWQAI
jgi:hypothetical protein